MTDDLPLAAEFPPTTQAQWRKLVEAALKGAAFDKRLVSQTYDGLRIEPLYARAAGAKPVAGRPARPWQILQRIDHPDPAAANAQALEDLENGATGLTLVFAGSLNANGYGLAATPETLSRALKDVQLDAGVTFDFNLSPATREAVQHFVALVRSRKLAPASVDLRASLNPIGGLAATGVSPRPWSELSKYVASAVRDLAGQGFRGPFMVADGRIIHNAGGSEAQELAFALAAAVDCLRALEAGGTPLDAARGMIYFRLAADADEFLTIAKLRAMRKLWARVEEACGLNPEAHDGGRGNRMADDDKTRSLREHAAHDHCGCRGRPRRRRQYRGATAHRRDRATRRIRPPRRAQHATHSSGGIQSRQSFRSCRRLRRDRGSDKQTLAAAWSQFQEIDKAGGAMGCAQTGVLFIITQQVQPAFSMHAMQSQQAWIISQHFGSPLVQVMQTPSSVISHLHMPMVRLQQQTIMPFIIMQQRAHAAGQHRAEVLHHAAGHLVVAGAGDLHAARALLHLEGAARHHHPVRAASRSRAVMPIIRVTPHDACPCRALAFLSAPSSLHRHDKNSFPEPASNPSSSAMCYSKPVHRALLSWEGL